jgi:hypothetical protein
MTNPGHIDPGYVGPMHFTVINMGRQEFSLRVGEMIVTVLFFELSPGAKSDYLARTGSTDPRPPRQEDINRLSADFLDISDRAGRVAKREMETAGVQLNAHDVLLKTLETRGKMAVGWFSLALAVISIATPIANYWLTAIADLKDRLTKLETSINLEKRVKALEDNNVAQTTPLTPTPGAVPCPRVSNLRQAKANNRNVDPLQLTQTSSAMPCLARAKLRILPNTWYRCAGPSTPVIRSHLPAEA